MAQSYGQNNLAIFVYGSLLSDPGEKIFPHIVDRIPCPSPWPIEYARRAKLRGDGPTLVIHHNGGIVQGRLLVLDLQLSALDELIEWLWEREGNPPRELLKQMECNGFDRVLYCDLESNLTDEEINPESLAQFAIDSVHKRPERNAVKYLANNIAQGIITPLTYAYRDAILRRTGAAELAGAEEFILRSGQSLKAKKN